MCKRPGTERAWRRRGGGTRRLLIGWRAPLAAGRPHSSNRGDAQRWMQAAVGEGAVSDASWVQSNDRKARFASLESPH